MLQDSAAMEKSCEIPDEIKMYFTAKCCCCSTSSGNSFQIPWVSIRVSDADACWWMFATNLDCISCHLDAMLYDYVLSLSVPAGWSRDGNNFLRGWVDGDGTLWGWMEEGHNLCSSLGQTLHILLDTVPPSHPRKIPLSCSFNLYRHTTSHWNWLVPVPTVLISAFLSI